MPPSLSEKWTSAVPLPDMRLPPVNPYIPTDFSLKTTVAQQAEAVLACTVLAASMQLPVVLATPPELLVDKSGGWPFCPE